jgi:hypothetical protein
MSARPGPATRRRTAPGGSPRTSLSPERRNHRRAGTRSRRRRCTGGPNPHRSTARFRVRSTRRRRERHARPTHPPPTMRHPRRHRPLATEAHRPGRTPSRTPSRPRLGAHRSHYPARTARHATQGRLRRPVRGPTVITGSRPIRTNPACSGQANRAPIRRAEPAQPPLTSPAQSPLTNPAQARRAHPPHSGRTNPPQPPPTNPAHPRRTHPPHSGRTNPARSGRAEPAHPR